MIRSRFPCKFVRKLFFFLNNPPISAFPWWMLLLCVRPPGAQWMNETSCDHRGGSRPAGRFHRAAWEHVIAIMWHSLETTALYMCVCVCVIWSQGCSVKQSLLLVPNTSHSLSLSSWIQAPESRNPAQDYLFYPLYSKLYIPIVSIHPLS